MSISHFELIQDTKEFPTSGIKPRTDVATENTVEHGIALQHTVGTACAIEYLLAQGVSRKVTQRVLTGSERRRV